MRYFVLAAILAASPVFANQPDPPGPEGRGGGGDGAAGEGGNECGWYSQTSREDCNNAISGPITPPEDTSLRDYWRDHDSRPDRR